MRLTRGSDYGLRGLAYLARQPSGQVVLVREVAEAQHLPESYLAKIFQELVRQGVMVSHRGARGGFSLARDPSDINLREVVEAIEGPIELVPCLEAEPSCDQIDDCTMWPALQAVQDQLVGALEGMTVRHLVDGGTPSPVQ
jgi:Rrf2 family protein